MELISLLRENTTFFLSIVGLFSLLVGSFLNAAIYRIPIMLQKGWRECQELFGGDKDTLAMIITNIQPLCAAISMPSLWSYDYRNREYTCHQLSIFER